MTGFNLWLDGSIVGLYLVGTMIAGLTVRRYVGKVEDFLVAGREMNVYLGIASLAATEFGIVSCMYSAELGYKYGFAGATPGLIMCLAMFLVGYTGFCIKPLRDSGAITIPELFEKRFGPRIRWASGVVVVLGGLLNMGVFLRTGGDFLVEVSGLKAGHIEMIVRTGDKPAPTGDKPAPTGDKPAPTGDKLPGEVCRLRAGYLEIMMTTLLIGVAVYTILGGMLSVLITDFLQFIVMSIGLIAISVLILNKIGWDTLTSTVATHYEAGGFNPFHNGKLGWSFVAFQTFLNTAAVLTWQTTIARVLAAKDSRTGQRVYTGTAFFFVARFLIPAIWGIAALAYLAPGIIGEKTTPLAMPKMLAEIVPPGLMGLLIAAMLAADMSTDSSYMLTWASVIYNDILRPFRQSWSEKKGILINRMIVGVIGVFLLVYGLWYQPAGDIWTYLSITGTIYLSSMSVLLVGCCYWRRANSWGAAAAICCGAVVPTATLVLQRVGRYTEFFTEYQNHCGIATFLIVAVAMVVGSLLKPQPKAAGATLGPPEVP